MRGGGGTKKGRSRARRPAPLVFVWESLPTKPAARSETSFGMTRCWSSQRSTPQTLSNRTQPTTQKNIVYAYPTLQDAATSQATVKDPQVMALPVPVVQILFQLLAMEPINSLIFFETPGQIGQGVEIRRQDMQSLIQAQLQQTQQTSAIPPDMA